MLELLQIISGVIWLAFTIFAAVTMYSGNGTVEVNGEIVAQEEFNLMLGPKIFFLLFFLVGVFILFTGLKKVYQNIRTDAKGVESYGYIHTITRCGHVNGKPLYTATLIVLNEDSTVQEYTESIGHKAYTYGVGKYVYVKVYKNDVNILGLADEYLVPDKLKEEAKQFQTNNDSQIDSENVIVINGVEYVKKD